MKHSKLLMAAALSAAAWCSASQAQNVIYGVEYYGGSTGSTPSESNWTAYPSSPANIGYAVSEYWDRNGILQQRVDPVVIERGTTTYVYPDAAVVARPSTTEIYTTPRGNEVYVTRPWDSRN